MTAPLPAKLPRLPFVLLGLMTALTFGGPIAIGFALRGGASPNWPPDRPVEWFIFAGVSAMVFVLMMACLSLTLSTRRAGLALPKTPTGMAAPHDGHLQGNDPQPPSEGGS